MRKLLALAAAAALVLTASCGNSAPKPGTGGKTGPSGGVPSGTAPGRKLPGDQGPGAGTRGPVIAPAVNRPPTVSIDSPADKAELGAPATIAISARAADADGKVAKVEFFQGTTKLGESTAAPYRFEWATVAAGSYTLSAKATDDAGATATSAEVTVKVAASQDKVWIEDELPAGANAQQDGEDAWTWVEANPAPQSGKKCHQSNTADGEHQHFFTDATDTLAVAAGEKLFVYVHLDAASAPTQVMLQWHENGSWEHRAYWGANSIEWGEDGTESRRSMGALPAAGKWVRLEVPAAQVGLEGKTVDGMAFTLFGGKATWDCAGKTAGK